MSHPPDPRPSFALRVGRSLYAASLAFLTPRRIITYPLVSFAVLVAVGIYDALTSGGPFGGDFLSFYTGGSLVRVGHSEALTLPDAQHGFQERLLGRPLDGVALWVSPPYFAWLFLPLSLLPYLSAFLVFVSLSALALWAGLRMLARELAMPASAALLLWVALQYYPTLAWLLNGQVTALWLTAYIVGFVLLRRGLDGGAGLVLGLFACKPQLALGLGVALLAARRWRAILGGLASGGALILLGFATLPNAMLAYAKHGSALVSFVRSGGYPVVGLSGSFEFATLLLDAVSPRAAAVLGIFLALTLLGAIAALWARREWRPGTAAWDLRMAATFALGTIASPHLYNYDLMLLMLPLFIAAAKTKTPHGLLLDGGALLVTSALLWLLGLLGPALSLAQQALTKSLFGVPLALQLGVPVVALWGYLAWRAAAREDALGFKLWNCEHMFPNRQAPN